MKKHKHIGDGDSSAHGLSRWAVPPMGGMLDALG